MNLSNVVFERPQGRPISELPPPCIAKRFIQKYEALSQHTSPSNQVTILPVDYSTKLPREIWRFLFFALDEFSLHQASLVNRLFNAISQDDELWEFHALQRDCFQSTGGNKAAVLANVKACNKAAMQCFGGANADAITPTSFSQYAQRYLAATLNSFKPSSTKMDAFVAHDQIVKKIMDSDAKTRLQLVDALNTLLATNPYSRMIAHLLTIGIKPTYQTIVTALRNKVSFEILRLLMSKKPILGLHELFIRSTIQIALENRASSEIIGLLLEGGATVTDLLLHTAMIFKAPIEVFALLVKYGAKPINNAADGHGNTTLDYARHTSTPAEIINLLIDAGAM